MRPRTTSVVNVHEYFSQADGESDQEEDEDDAYYSRLPRNVSKSLRRSPSFSKSKKLAKRERTSTLDSWEGTDVEDDDEDDDDDDDDDSVRARTCSHDRRISFGRDVNVVEIPARSSFDADYKRRVWYSPEEYSLMRELV